MSLTIAEYRAILACSFTGLRAIARSPAYAKWTREHPSEDTEATLRGSAFHCAVLEPNAFDARYCIKDFDARTKEGKARKAEIEATGLQPLSVDTWDAVKRSADAVLLDPAAKPILDSATVREVPIVGVTINGVECKGIPDARSKDGRLLLDLKSTTEAAPENFPRFIQKGRVDSQLAFYEALMNVTDAARFVIAVKDDAPHEVYVYEFDDEMTAMSWTWLDRQIARWKACIDTGAWSAGPGTVLTAKRAPWDRLDVEEIPETDPLDVEFTT